MSIIILKLFLLASVSKYSDIFHLLTITTAEAAKNKKWHRNFVKHCITYKKKVLLSFFLGVNIRLSSETNGRKRRKKCTTLFFMFTKETSVTTTFIIASLVRSLFFLFCFLSHSLIFFIWILRFKSFF